MVTTVIVSVEKQPASVKSMIDGEKWLVSDVEGVVSDESCMLFRVTMKEVAVSTSVILFNFEARGRKHEDDSSSKVASMTGRLGMFAF